MKWINLEKETELEERNKGFLVLFSNIKKIVEAAFTHAVYACGFFIAMRF